jgi:uncharacterized protein (DUF1501 family)
MHSIVHVSGISQKVMSEMETKNSSECEEYRLAMRRRTFLGLSVSLLTSAIPLFPDKLAASIVPRNKILFVLLRGGMDSLELFPPVFDERYAELRGELSFTSGEVTTLNSGFSIHPDASSLLQIEQEGNLAYGVSCGLPVRNRSHFDCQEALENGLPEVDRNATGWLNRALSVAGSGGSAISISNVPRLLSGPAPILSWSPTWYGGANEEVIDQLEVLYHQRENDLWQSLSRGLQADDIARGGGAGWDPDIDALARGFIGAARLLRSNGGPRIAVLSVGGWDTHTNQSGANGQFTSRLSTLNHAIVSFRSEMENEWDNVTVVCMTEFGRSATTNGAGGTEHGTGMPVLVFGGGVRGGFLGDWPGLRENQLVDRTDLMPTFDLRSVFKGVLSESMSINQNTLSSIIFPGSSNIPILHFRG